MWLKKTSTDNKKLADRLRDEKAKSAIILNAIEDGVILLDTEGTLQLINPGAANITGWNVDDARGLKWESVFHFVDEKGEDSLLFSEKIKQLLASGETVRDNEACLRTKSGKTVAVSIVATALLDENRQITGAVAVFRDVSAERQAEKQRAEFISTASHEMRTPVAAIEGYLALALNDKVSAIDSKARDYLEKAHESTQHLGRLFQDLLTSAKAEDGRLSNHPVVVEVGEMLEQLTEDLTFAAQKKGLFMEYTIGTSGTSQTIDASGGSEINKVVRPLYYTYADPDRLREVITNLFDNAVKYTDRGKITIGLTGNNQIVQFYIRDTGHGIPAEDVPHLFQKFYRVDNSATRTIGGTGLGLFICRKIIELYKGRIWVESKLDEGSTFYINLPRLSGQKAEELRAQEAQNNLIEPINQTASSVVQ